MKKTNENKLFKKYPTIFPGGRKVDPMQSLICFGLEVEDGWYDLIDRLCNKILIISEQDKIEVTAVQVKEKFGGLRFYTSGGNNRLWDVISEAEKESYKICEICGVTGELRTDIGWYKTLCEVHHKAKLKNILKSQ